MENLTVVDLLNSAKDLFNKRDYQRSQALFSEVLKKDDKNSEAYFHLGNIFHLNGEIGKAIKAFDRVLTIDPCHTDAAISLSVLYNDIGQYQEAKRIFDMANERVKNKAAGSTSRVEDIHINKKFSAKHYELAEMYLSYGRFDEALFEYNKASALDPENLLARVKVAKVYAKKGFTAKAFDELRKLKNEYPNYLPCRIALGVLHYANGNIIDAQNEWKKILAQDPHNSEAAMYLNLSKAATETNVV
jgi:tetratricopeptide (TPR) repeat protein